MKNGRDYTIQTIRQAADVLDLVANSKTPITSAAIESETGLSSNTVFRILWNLEALGWAKRQGEGYALDTKMALYWARYRAKLEHERDVIEHELEQLEGRNAT